MNIDINNINSGRPEGPNRQDSAKVSTELKSASSKTASAPDETSSSDSVSLSSAAKDLAQIENDLKSLPEIDQGKVDAIKARLENGDYHINAQNMAQKMLNMEN